MSGLARDETTEPASRDQILRRERGQGKTRFPAQVTTNRIAAIIGTMPVDAQPAERDIMHHIIHGKTNNIFTSLELLGRVTSASQMTCVYLVSRLLLTLNRKNKNNRSAAWSWPTFSRLETSRFVIIRGSCRSCSSLWPQLRR